MRKYDVKNVEYGGNCIWIDIDSHEDICPYNSLTYGQSANLHNCS